MHSLHRWFTLSLAAMLLGACAARPPSALHPSQLRSAESQTPGLGEALVMAQSASRAGLQDEASIEHYRSAITRAVEAWMARPRAAGKPAKRFSAEAAGMRFTVTTVWPKGVDFDALIPAATIKARELQKRMTRTGIGLPLVAWWKHTPERAATEPFMAPAGYLTPVTATLTFRSLAKQSCAVTLELHDPRITRTIRTGTQNLALAADFSAPGEFLLSQRDVRMPGIGALLNSEKHLDKLGLISLERPRPDRAPVILVHGLMSRPATWQNVVNELWSDAELQRSCQFYFFRYPTGVPVIYSAAQLRERLGMLHRTLKQAGGGAAMNHMVLIGHSMGGLVSKSQVQDSGDRLWVNVFGTTPDKLKLSAPELQKIRAYLEYKPNPYISRVIFVATPHRGSQMAEGMLGAMGRALVNLPGHILSDATNLMTGDLPEHGPLGDLARRGIPTSINNLSPKSKFVQTSINLPLRPGLHVHSIIGNKKHRPLDDPQCSDGVVPYRSAHLDGVESELVVPYGHSAHEHPEAIREIRRLLLQHVRQL